MKLVPLVAVLLVVGGANWSFAQKEVTFEAHIAPILRVYCWNCHGSGGLDGQLDLRSQPLALRGGKSGPAIVPGNAEKSLLYRRIVARQMPPAKTTHKNVVFSPVKPTAKHVGLIRRWIDEGAKAAFTQRPLNEVEDPPITSDDRSWWAFLPPTRPALPQVKGRDRVRSAVDAFVLSRLEKKGLTLAPDAARLATVRRLHLDLTGLPPTPRQVEDYLHDASPDHYERLVDRLLASPHFGERWGRHWLDAAGYVDTGGRDNDASIINIVEGRWRYRDYVIRSLNHDKPYNRFVTEQLAGDELISWRQAKRYSERHLELLVATGFLRLAADSTSSKELNTGDIRNQVLLDTVQLVGSNLLGLTIQCAQCHTHKFDPINHADYYRFRAFFTAGYNIQRWKQPTERMTYTVSPSEKVAIDATNAQVQRETNKLRAKIKQVRDAARKTIAAEKYQRHVPTALTNDVRTALATPSKKRTKVQNYLLKKFGATLSVSAVEVSKRLTPSQRQQNAQRERQIARLQQRRRSYSKFPAFWEEAKPPRSYLFRRGEFEKPGPEVQAAIPTVLNAAKLPTRLKRATQTSQRRLRLAAWLTDPRNPLFARVFVNRIWQHYFGRGIVATPDNFGASGVKPTHPSLLDWLATELIRQNWSIKAVHRQILLSTTYRQATYRADERLPSGPHKVDPANLLLWKMPLRRLPAEIIRDNILQASGSLVTTFGGRAVPIKPAADGMVTIDASKLASPADRFRRTLYLTFRRNYHLTQLNVFNQPVVSPNCTRRHHSPIVSQSLAMMNGKFVMEQATALADRIQQSGRRDEHAIRQAFRLVLCRPPSPAEMVAAGRFVADIDRLYRQSKTKEPPHHGGLRSLCQMLLNTSEFLYVP